MTHWKIFRPKACSVRLVAPDKLEALAEVVENMVGGDALPAPLRKDALAALLAREDEGSTGVGMNVAIPHVKLKRLESAVCSVSIHPAGLEWAAVDGAPVHIVFAVLRPEKVGALYDPERHLELMRWIARLARDGDFRRFALQVKTKAALVDLLKEKSAV